MSKNSLFIYHNKDDYDQIYNEDVYTEMKKENYSAMIYRFKFFFTDGSYKLGDAKSKTPIALINDLDGLISWEEFDALHQKDIVLNTNDVLKISFDAYKKVYPNLYRMEIINTDTNEVIDFIE